MATDGTRLFVDGAAADALEGSVEVGAPLVPSSQPGDRMRQ
jgi:hypothetical protein